MKLLSWKMFKFFSDENYLKLKYFVYFKKKINLNNPQSFNEKLQWLKLYDRNPLYVTMVDKYDVKKYVENKIGKEYIIPTIGIYKKINEINFNKLPNKFVIKCTHDCGSVVIVKNKNKIDYDEIKRKIENKLKVNYYYSGREWPYKNVKPRIIIEKYMEDNKTNELRDYKFFCFNGEVKCFKIDFNRATNHQANYYAPTGELLEFGEIICPPDYNKKLDMPKNLNKMIELSEKLSKGITFLRVDFYEMNGKIYFGELTFYPASGLGKFTDEKWDYKLGEMLELPYKIKE